MFRTTLPNGLRLDVVERPDSRSVAATLSLDVGARDEPTYYAGLAHFVEHMVFRSSEHFPDEGPSLALERVGGEINAGTDHESTSFDGEVTPKDAHLLFDALLDIVQAPLFEARHIDSEREAIKSEIQGEVDDDPVAHVQAMLSQTLWQGPLGREIAGTTATLGHINQAALVEFWREWYRPDRAILSVAGNISAEEVQRRIQQATANWQPAGLRPKRATPRHATKLTREEPGRVSHAHLCMAVYGLRRMHPDARALDLLAAILGAGMGSVLVRRLREDLGLVYRVPVYHDSFVDTGAFIVNTSAEPEAIPRIITEVQQAVELMAKRVPAEELSRARELVAGSFSRGLDDNGVLSAWYSDVEMDDDFHTPEQEVELLYQVTTADVERVARYLSAQTWHTALIRPSDSSVEPTGIRGQSNPHRAKSQAGSAANTVTKKMAQEVVA